MPVSLSSLRLARTCFTALSRLSACLPYGKTRCHSCSPPPVRLDLEASADQRGSFPHAEKPLALSGRRPRASSADIESLTIVAHDKSQRGFVLDQLDDDRARARMTNDIRQGFLRDTEAGDLDFLEWPLREWAEEQAE